MEADNCDKVPGGGGEEFRRSSVVLGQRWKEMIWVFPKMVVPNNHGFPTRNDHFGVLWGYHYFRKHPYDPKNKQ